MKLLFMEGKRAVKENGSMLFILQPNYEKIGKMSLWLWEFLLWGAKEWNLVQNLYWHNSTTPPLAGTNRKQGLTRNSMKYLLWFGNPTCYRNQDEILREPSIHTVKGAVKENDDLKYVTSGQSYRKKRINSTYLERGGVTPMNIFIMSNANSKTSGGAYGHGAATPYALCDELVRYLVPENGVVFDPFAGSGTIPMAAKDNNRSYLACEILQENVDICNLRLNNA